MSAPVSLTRHHQVTGSQGPRHNSVAPAKPWYARWGQWITTAPAERVIFWLVAALFSVLYALARFSGLEYHGGYFGNAALALRARSFFDAISSTPFKPTMVSVYYWLVRLVGERWLDDRLTIMVYLGLVIAAVIVLDKTARLFGAERFEERIAILSLMLLGHRFKDNLAQLVSHAEFNPTTFAGPAALWLLYATLAGKPASRLFPLMLLVSLISIKNAWLPVLIGLIIFYRERLGSRAKLLVGSGAIVFVVWALVVYYFKLRPPGEAHPILFNTFLLGMDNSEANPFMEQTWFGNIMFVLLSLGGFVVKLPTPAVMRRVKVIASIGLAVWLVGGVYLSYAPDAIKIPYLIPINFNRALWWPQYVLFMAIGVAALKWIQRTQSWTGLATAYAIVLMLYLTPFTASGVHVNLKQAGALGLMTVLMLWRYRRASLGDGALPSPNGIRRWRIESLTGVMCLRTLAVALCATTLLTLAGRIWIRWPHLSYLVHHGVMGDNPGAKWVGVNEYFRTHTPPSATVISLSMRVYPWEPERLTIDYSFTIRSGRQLPAASLPVYYFDLASLERDNVRARHVEELIKAWERQDAAAASASLSVLGAPDYVVVPTVKTGWLLRAPRFPYTVEASIREFTIMRRLPSP